MLDIKSFNKVTNGGYPWSCNGGTKINFGYLPWELSFFDPIKVSGDVDITVNRTRRWLISAGCSLLILSTGAHPVFWSGDLHTDT